MNPGSAVLTSFLTALGLFSTVSPAGAQNTFEHDFNTNPALAGMELRRSARWRTFGSDDGSGYISLTDAASNQSGKLLLPDFSGPAGIDGFTATMRVRIGGGTCCGGPGLWIPAEGMSFSFAAPSDPAVAALDGTGWLPGGPQEGTATGLSICLDTFDNGGGEGPAIEVKLDGKTIAAAPLNPRTGDGWATLELIVEPCGLLTLIYNGGTVFNAVPIGFMPPVGRFLFGARTSDGNDNHWIDDVTISTTAYAGPHPRVVAKYPASTGDVRLDSPIQFTIEERGDPVDAGSIRLTLDGIMVPATVSTTNVQGFTQHIVEYSPDLLLTPFLHSAVLTYTSASGYTCEVANTFLAQPCLGPGPPDFISPAPGETVEGTLPLVWGRFFSHCYTTVSVIGVSINDVDVTAESQITSGVDGTEFSYQVPAPGFPPNSTVNVAVSLLRVSVGVRTTNIFRWTFQVGPITPDTLFIEAEDFNFSDADAVNPGQHINFGAPDGSLLNREATVGIDYYDSENNDADPRSIYRPDTGVEAAKGGPAGGNDSASRGARDVTVNWIVGWMTSGEWMNYTREFPGPGRWYHVYARVASVCPEQAQLDLVTSDPSQPEQTTRKLGVFDSPSSGAWEMFHTFPSRQIWAP